MKVFEQNKEKSLSIDMFEEVKGVSNLMKVFYVLSNMPCEPLLGALTTPCYATKTWDAGKQSLQEAKYLGYSTGKRLVL